MTSKSSRDENISSTASGGRASVLPSVGDVVFFSWEDLDHISKDNESKHEGYLKIHSLDMSKYPGKSIYCNTKAGGFQILTGACKFDSLRNSKVLEWIEISSGEPVFAVNKPFLFYKKIASKFTRVHTEDIEEGDELYSINDINIMKFIGVAHEQIADSYEGELRFTDFYLWKTKEGYKTPPGLYIKQSENI